MKRSIRRAVLAMSAALVAGAGAISCSGPSIKGELMVVVQTDMALPKDIDTVRIEVISSGKLLHGETFTKVGTDQESLQIPATIGILVGEDPGKPATVRLMAWQNNNLRLLRTATSTVPEKRLAMMRVPLQWLCDGQATQVGNPLLDPQASEVFSVSSTCPEGQTCIAGSCADSTVDSSTLPDYSADDVFGGGTGKNGDGTCFDTSTCFAGGSVADLDLASCTFKSSADVNVAIMAEGDGVCGPAGCFVALDAQSDSGWKRPDGDASLIQVPQIICKKICASNPNNPDCAGIDSSGTVGAKAVGVAFSKVTDKCKLKTEGTPVCGTWSSTGKNEFKPDDSLPVTLATGQNHPVSIAVDGFNVYWTNSGTFGEADGSIKAVGIVGGSPTTLVPDQAGPRGLALVATDTDETLYWTNGGLTGTDGAVLKIDLAPPFTPSTLQQMLASPDGITAGGGTVFFTAFGTGAILGFTEADPSALITISAAAAGQYPYRIAVDSTMAFWTNEGKAGSMPPDGSINFANVDGSAPPAPIGALVTPRGIALDLDGGTAAKGVYWTSFADPGEVLMVAINGGVPATTPVKIATEQGYPNGIAIDGEFVYWTNRGAGTVMRAPKDGSGAATEIAAGQSAPGAIILDTVNVYWVNEGLSDQANGGIVKMKKPQ